MLGNVSIFSLATFCWNMNDPLFSLPTHSPAVQTSSLNICLQMNQIQD